ncbi:MAG: peptidyl-prolyl cis-trans isomerase [Gammaproteobacteria bacterium]|nr:peptidyl-prolyl cis-trans isomerase [Gammaproteobacteria bacterium]
MKKMFREPLLYFFLLGGLIFAIYPQVANRVWESDSEIIITEQRIQALKQGFKKIRQRLPSSDETDKLINDYVRDEVLYREALALGLDRDDGIVRQRMQQKMAFLFENIVKQVVPDDEVLQAYLDLNADKYRRPARLSFFQVYINANKRGDTALADAHLLLAQLRDKAADPEASGDLLMLERRFIQSSEQEVARLLGSDFLHKIDVSRVGSWQGPITSGFGLHLVRLDEYIAGELPTLAVLRDNVLRDWLVEKGGQSNDAFYENLRKRYRVRIESN